jgi:hypothetical protein
MMRETPPFKTMYSSDNSQSAIPTIMTYAYDYYLYDDNDS